MSTQCATCHGNGILHDEDKGCKHHDNGPCGGSCPPCEACRPRGEALKYGRMQNDKRFWSCRCAGGPLHETRKEMCAVCNTHRPVVDRPRVLGKWLNPRVWKCSCASGSRHDRYKSRCPDCNCVCPKESGPEYQALIMSLDDLPPRSLAFARYKAGIFGYDSWKQVGGAESFISSAGPLYNRISLGHLVSFQNEERMIDSTKEEIVRHYTVERLHKDVYDDELEWALHMMGYCVRPKDKPWSGVTPTLVAPESITFDAYWHGDPLPDNMEERERVPFTAMFPDVLAEMELRRGVAAKKVNLASTQAEGRAIRPTEADAVVALDPCTLTAPQTQEISPLRTDITDAAWRTAGSQFVKLAREPLVGLLSRHLGPDDPSLRARIATFLTTEAGAAILAAILSGSLSALPIPAGETVTRLARELRVRATADAGDLLADVLTGPLRAVTAAHLRGEVQAPAVSRLDDGGQRVPGQVASTPARAYAVDEDESTR